MYKNTYICIYIYKYIYTYTYTYIYMYINICIIFGPNSCFGGVVFAMGANFASKVLKERTWSL